MLRRFTGSVFWLVAVALTAGCALTAQPTREFSAVSQDYLQRLRWQDYAGAARYQQPDQRQDFLQRFADLDGLHIVDTRLEAVDFDAKGSRATTRGLLEYYLLPSLTVKKFRFHQEWVYAPIDSSLSAAWSIETPFPPFP